MPKKKKFLDAGMKKFVKKLQTMSKASTDWLVKYEKMEDVKRYKGHSKSDQKYSSTMGTLGKPKKMKKKK